MNGKIKTKFAALFAVALMITVCVVPVVGNEDVQAADVPSMPEGVSDIKIQMFTEDSTDFSDLIYCANGSKLPASVDPVEWKQVGTTGCFINVNKDSEYFGKFLRFGQTGLSNEEIVGLGKAGGWLPLIQTSWMYSGGQNLDISISGPNEGVVSDSANSATDRVKEGVAFDSVEFVSSATLIAGGSATFGYDDLEDVVGEFDVKVLAGDAKIKTEKFEFGTEGLKKVTGKITDADDNVIEGVKVAYKIDGKSGTAVSDENGIYEFFYAEGAVVEITGATYDGDAYTFDKEYVFGTLDSFIEYNDIDGKLDFQAKESTGTVTVMDKDGSEEVAGAEIDLKWYYEFESTTGSEVSAVGDNVTTKAPAGVTAGTVKALSKVSDENGKFVFTYLEPAGTPTITGYVEDTFNSVLIAIASGPSGFTYSTVNPTSYQYAEGESLGDLFESDKGFAGMADATDDSATVYSNEYIFEIFVKSQTDVPIEGAKISAALYSQKENESEKYDVAAVKNADIDVLGDTDAQGRTQITFKAYPDEEDETKYYIYVKANNTSDYTFDIQNVEVGEDVESIPNQVSDDNEDGSTQADADGHIDAVTLTAKENSYEVSGGVLVPGVKADENGKWPELTVKYTDGIGSQVVLDKAAEGSGEQTGYAVYAYSFIVIEGNSSVITPSMKGFKFNPVSFTTPTVSETNVKVPDFKAESTSAKMKYNDIELLDTFKVEGLEEGDIVLMTYAVDGKLYKTPVKTISGDQGNNYYAEYGVYGIKGSYVQLISVDAEGYEIGIDEDGKYVAEPLTLVMAWLYLYEDEETITPAADFELEFLQIDEENEFTSLGKYKTDQYGMIKFYVSDPAYIMGYIDGNMIEFLTSEGGYVVHGDLDVSGYIEKPVSISIMYQSAFNSTDVSGAVNYSNIAESDAINAMNGDSVALKAPKIDNFEFVAWMVDGVVVSDKADYTLIVEQHFDENGSAVPCTAVALYSAVHYEEPVEGLSMNVLVIGIVILILGILAVAYGIISKKQ